MHDDDIAAAVALAPRPGRAVDLAWLTDSHRSPERFFAALCGVLDAVAATPAKSRVGERFDLYYDMVTRHLGSDRAALQIHEPGGPDGPRWVLVPFEALHARCSARAGAWAAQGVKQGAKLCVVLPFGDECVVSILSALRLGLCVSWLEPGGPDYLALRLVALAPMHIATEPFYAAVLGDAAGLILATDQGHGPAWPGSSSHAYLPGERCAAWFSPLRGRPHVPVPLACDDAYLGALRDGAVALALRPGDHLAAPGFDALQHQPALLFAALLMGATFVHITAEDAVRDPSLLTAFPLRSLGLTAPVRDALLRARTVRRPAWAHVFKNPEEPTEWESWRDLIEALELEDTPMSNILVETASGGALLCSPRRTGKAQLGALMNVAPAAGRAWCLLDFTGSGQPAVGDVGVFAPLARPAVAGEVSEPVEPRHIVIGRRRGAEYLYGGTTEARRSGRTYPVDEVLAVLSDCPFLDGASVVAVVAGGPTVDHRFVLLGFTGAEPEGRFEALRGKRVEELTRVLSTRLTPDFLPDMIELFPCHARRKDGAVDHPWCHSQYLTGALFLKRRSPVFTRLTALRGAVIAA